ncbi:hypothetical protein LAZ67_10001234 [Cordylochernes scorpioides]|uniref:DUF4219 domain-containing protein n=1 Tax=Cordylochernes scorpioides TaxID=51811 RepID=A0ABY6KWC9_9ARAC|nr:hypothetical protein LAZ67_10001234 [Cordylochernes scorpioides]
MPYQEGHVFHKMNIVLVLKTDFAVNCEMVSYTGNGRAWMESTHESWKLVLPRSHVPLALQELHSRSRFPSPCCSCPASTYSPTSGSRAWLIRDTTCKMISTLINTPLEKLNDQNYRSWKYNKKMMLIERELWKYVTEPAPDEEASRTIFNMKQEKALAMIALTISPSQQIHIMDCTTAREAWDTLEQVYEPK